MADTYKILAINPGSTSTKIAVFENDKELMHKNVSHEAEKLAEFDTVQDQLDYRKEMVEEACKEAGIDLDSIDIFVGRGGGLHPVPGGTYIVDDVVLRDAAIGVPGQHPAQLASQICAKFVAQYGGEAYIVNPPDTDELQEVARFTGIKGLYRDSAAHALNQKEIAIRYCADKGLKYDECNLIIAHIGGGISVTAHRQGLMVDGNNIIKGEGPMTPTRAGALPTTAVLKMAYSGEYTEKELKTLLTKNSGFVSHLGTSDAREVESMMEEGNTYAKKVYDAMIYQICKAIGECAVVLKGDVQGIILTGGMSYSDYLTAEVKDYAGWICPVTVMPGELEMEALAAGCMRVKTGIEEAKHYAGKPAWGGVAELQ